ncbi:MAG: WbqC family protein [Ruminococcaceae bacterium]|nr:WbqC family protein [Oscillospiraceae bacterium]
MKSVAMLQPNYIPWKGVFDMINRVDIFVFYDDVQFTKRDWRSRNKIPTSNGDVWLTVPVLTKGRMDQLICEAEIDTSVNWQKKHHKTLTLTYAKSPFLSKYEQLLFDFYFEKTWINLSEMNIFMTKYICNILGIRTRFYKSSDLNCQGDKDGEKVISICKKLGCNHFINGPAAKAFTDEQKYADAEIELEYMSYEYPIYNQLYKPFNHHVTVLDMLFNLGDKTADYIWGDI